MKLADIKDPSIPMAMVNYAEKNNYRIIELMVHEEMPVVNIVALLYKCFGRAEKEGCVEFCIKEVRNQYKFSNDGHVWRVSICGFIPKGKL